MKTEPRLECAEAGAALKALPDESVDCCITSPPYWGLRDYGVEGQLGLEPCPELYVDHLVEIFREVRRVLRKEGTLWLNLGDCYASWGGAGWQGYHGARATRAHTQRSLKKRTAVNGLKPKDLVGVPWMVAFALRADGWWLRSDIIWAKGNPMPESVRDRPTKAHEYIFLLSKNEKYFYNADAIAEPFAGENEHDRTGGPYAPPGQSKAGSREDGARGSYQPGGRHKRSVWTVNTRPFDGAHFAVFPTGLVEPMVKAGCPIGGLVLDPFMGSGTTGEVAIRLGRRFHGIDLNPAYIDLAAQRFKELPLELPFE